MKEMEARAEEKGCKTASGQGKVEEIKLTLITLLDL